MMRKLGFINIITYSYEIDDLDLFRRRDYPCYSLEYNTNVYSTHFIRKWIIMEMEIIILYYMFIIII